MFVPVTLMFPDITGSLHRHSDAWCKNRMGLPPGNGTTRQGKGCEAVFGQLSQDFRGMFQFQV